MLLSAIRTKYSPRPIRFLDTLIFLYGVLVVIATTHQPLVYLWFKVLLTGLPDDLTTQGLEMTIIGLQIPAIVLLFQKWRPTPSFRSSPHLLIALLVIYMICSTWWSTLPGRTLWDMGMISISVCSITYLVNCLSNIRAITTIFLGLLPAVLMSYWAVWRNWEGSKQYEDGPWLGIFGNRNTLAPLAAGVFLLGIFLVIHMLKKRRTAVFAPLVLALSVVGMTVLLETKSMSSVIGLIFAGFMTINFYIWKVGPIRRIRSVVRERIFVSIFLSGFFALAVSAVFFSDSISSSLGRTSGLSGRTDIWMESLRGIAEKPFLGWGWGTAWLTDSFRAELPSALTEHRWPHSLWMEFGLGGGFIALALVVAWALWGASRTMKMALRNNQSGLFMVTFPSFALVLLSMESMNWTFHWAFAVLVGTYLMAEKEPD